LENGIPLLKMPYKANRTEVIQSPAQWSPGSSYYGFYVSGYGYPIVSGTPSETSSRAAALSKASADMYDKMSDLNSFNLGIALAESKRTVGLIANTASRLAKTYSQMRKGRFRAAFKTLGVLDSYKLPRNNRWGPNGIRLRRAGEHRKWLQYQTKGMNKSRLSSFASEKWLEMSYGWTPLLYDVHGAAEYAANLLHGSNSDVSISGFGSVEDYLSSETSTLLKATHYEMKSLIDLELKVIPDSVRNASALGLTNPGLVGWELVPFSFVVDWFTPVGSWLESLTAFQGFDVVGKSLSYTYAVTAYGEYKPKGATCSYVVNNHERLVNFTVPSYPSPFLNFGARLGKKRFTSALALLRQAFKR
jgi:hypothetical protein